VVSEDKYDVIVVGAGPAGSTAAYLLAQGGLQVLMLDKKEFPRDKLCGGLLTRKTVKLLEVIYQTPVEYLMANQVISEHSYHYGVKHRGKVSIQGKLEYPFHLVNRQTYDTFWLSLARQAGVKFRAGEKVISLDPVKNQLKTAGGEQFSATVVMVADGAPSRLHRLLADKGVIKKEEKAGWATAMEIVVPQYIARSFPSCPAIYFGFIRWGYAWCFPRDKHRVLGICGLNKKTGKLVKRSFQAFLQANQISPDFICRAKSHPLPYGNYLSTPGAGNILLLGDAAGLADPLLGEGIYYAHKSAQLAARSVIQSYRSSDRALGIYKRLLTEDIISELRFARAGRQIIFSLPQALSALLISYLLRAHPRICEEVIQGQRSFKWFHHLAGNS
jgi:geranylgeranyl reductase family protein